MSQVAYWDPFFKILVMIVDLVFVFLLSFLTRFSRHFSRRVSRGEVQRVSGERTVADMPKASGYMSLYMPLCILLYIAQVGGMGEPTVLTPYRGF